MSAGRVILLVFGIIGVLISIGLLVGGGAILWVDNTIKDSEEIYSHRERLARYCYRACRYRCRCGAGLGMGMGFRRLGYL
jgi:hypothetical protein